MTSFLFVPNAANTCSRKFSWEFENHANFKFCYFSLTQWVNLKLKCIVMFGSVYLNKAGAYFAFVMKFVVLSENFLNFNSDSFFRHVIWSLRSFFCSPERLRRSVTRNAAGVCRRARHDLRAPKVVWCCALWVLIACADSAVAKRRIRGIWHQSC